MKEKIVDIAILILAIFDVLGVWILLLLIAASVIFL